MIITNTAKKEIILDGVIGQDWLGEGITAAGISEALDTMQNAKVTIRINSPGGAADEGIAIYNLLKRYPGGVDTVNDALAASAASVIFLAGNKRTMGAGSRVMIHKALTIEIGNADQMRKTASVLDAYDRSLVEIYASYLDKPDDEIEALLSAETWYNSAEAVDAKLATDQTATRSTSKAAMANWFKNPPQDLVAAACKRDFAKARMAIAAG